jgi:hypothetical protein
MGNQTLGRGKVNFSLFKPGTQTPAGFRYIGNTPSLQPDDRQSEAGALFQR